MGIGKVPSGAMQRGRSRGYKSTVTLIYRAHLALRAALTLFELKVSKCLR